MAKQEKILKVALVGIGGMGYCHYTCYGELQDTQIVAVCDVRTDMAQEKVRSYAEEMVKAGKFEKDAPLPRIYGDLDEMLSKENLDAVDICTPSYLHADMAVKCLKKGVHVLCEKPMTLSQADGERVLEAQKESGKKFMAAHVVRFMSPYVYLRKIIESGKYGNLLRLDMKRLSSVPRWSWEDWMRDGNRSGGVGFDLSVHDIDFVLSVLGLPEESTAIWRPLKNDSSYICSSMQYASGATVTCEATWYNTNLPFRADFLAVFDEGYVRLEGGVLTDNGNEVKAEENKQADVDLGINVGGDNAYLEEIAYFLNCVRHDLPVMYVSPESSAQTVNYTDALLKKAKRV